MAISQTNAVTRSPRRYGLSYEDLVAQRASTLPAVYAQRDSETQRRAELAARQRASDDSLALSNRSLSSSNQNFQTQLDFQMGMEESRASQEAERLAFERDRADREQRLAQSRLDLEAENNRTNLSIARENQSSAETSRNISTGLGVLNLGVNAYGAYRRPGDTTPRKATTPDDYTPSEKTTANLEPSTEPPIETSELGLTTLGDTTPSSDGTFDPNSGTFSYDFDPNSGTFPDSNFDYNFDYNFDPNSNAFPDDNFYDFDWNSFNFDYGSGSGDMFSGIDWSIFADAGGSFI